MSAHLHNQDISLLALAIGILDGGQSVVVRGRVAHDAAIAGSVAQHG
jgi:hypothetical protein